MIGGRRGPKVLGDDSQQVAFKLPAAVVAILHDAAKVNYESPANYVRRALITQLRADGLLVGAPAPVELPTPEAIERQLAAVKKAMDAAGLVVKDGKIVRAVEP